MADRPGARKYSVVPSGDQRGECAPDRAGVTSRVKGVFKIIENIFVPLLDSVNSAIDSYDYKSRLQEWAQEEQGAMPYYKVVREEGPDHDKTFWISVKVFDVESEGHGKSKKMAEQDAARKALEKLQELKAQGSKLKG